MSRDGWVRVLGVLTAMSSIATTGCGGDVSSGGASSSIAVCSGAKPAGCGGDVVGVWELTDYCLTTLQQDLACSAGTITVTLHSYTVSATHEYRSDGTWTSTSSGSSGSTAVYPVACLKTSCAQTTTTLEADPDVTSATCSEAGGKCTCNMTATFSATNDDGTYTTSGSQITETDSATGKMTTSDYCVASNALTEVSTDGVVHAVRK